MQQYTHIQQQIQVKQQQVNADGRALIAKAASLLQKSNKSDADVKKALDILEKGEALIGVTVQDQQRFGNIDGAALAKAVDTTYADGSKMLEKIDDLEIQEKQATAKIFKSQVEQRAVERYKLAQRLRWFAIISGIVAIGGALCYFTPILSMLPVLTNILKIFSFRK